jgi:hypothetical protein
VYIFKRKEEIPSNPNAHYAPIYQEVAVKINPFQVTEQML